jgi:hypothetical protein
VYDFYGISHTHRYLWSRAKPTCPEVMDACLRSQRRTNNRKRANRMPTRVTRRVCENLCDPKWSPIHLSSKVKHNFTLEKISPKLLLLLIFQKTALVINHPIGENSHNLVTLMPKARTADVGMLLGSQKTRQHSTRDISYLAN